MEVGGGRCGKGRGVTEYTKPIMGAGLLGFEV